jgi:UDP-2,3-diacylglucosamine pyrophosphatase LpxH
MSSYQTKHPLKFRSVFISDVHLGSRSCQAGYLLEFLKLVDTEYLYLVGDIVDLWSLSQSFYWPQEHNNVLRLLLSKAKHGTKVIYVPGNHDSIFRDYVDHQFGNVELRRETIHVTADGRQLLVTHGDDYEGAIKCASWLGHVGNHAYELILKANRLANWVRTKFGKRYWSLAGYLKHKAATAVRYIERYENALIHEAARRHLDGVICGHIHRAKISREDGIQYINCGDWVESCTTVVEDEQGRLTLLQWSDRQQLLDECVLAQSAAGEVEVSYVA